MLQCMSCKAYRALPPSGPTGVESLDTECFTGLTVKRCYFKLTLESTVWQKHELNVSKRSEGTDKEDRLWLLKGREGLGVWD